MAAVPRRPAGGRLDPVRRPGGPAVRRDSPTATGRRLRELCRGRDVAIVYALAVLGIGIAIAVQGPHELRDIVQESSTNLANLHRRPLTVLVASAFVVSPVWGLVILVPLVWAYGEVQRWLGRASAIIVGALGHVGATLFVATIQATALTRNRAGFRLVHDADVGVSYGLAAVAGLLVGRFAPPWRRRYLLICLVVLTGQLVVVQGFTAVGHITAWVFGCAISVPVHRSGRSAGGSVAADGSDR